jgi:AcrR family transcriptional regulator
MLLRWGQGTGPIRERVIRLTDVAATKSPARPTNAERSAKTREKLILATVDCLHRLGYHETSTTVVLNQVGLSRGAMLHHFPTKADLMIATSEYIAERRGIAHREGLDGVADDRERLNRLVDILWSELKSPTGVARIEIMLGSRSEPAFSARFRELNAELEQRHKDAIWPLAQRLGLTDRKLVDELTQLYAAALRGLAIDALDRGPDRLQGAVDLLKRYHLLLVGEQQ